MPHKTAVLFLNGQLSDPRPFAALASSADLRIAVDGGLRYLRELALLPDILIGDLDSVPPEWVSEAEAGGARVMRYPVEKDDTDLELALGVAIGEGCDRIRLLGALGGRLDHTLANLFLLLQPRFESLDLRILDPGQEIFLIRSEAQITGAPGDIISLLPLLGPARGVETDSLQYPLRRETLFPDRSRGISNVMESDQAVVRLDDGVLLCIHSSPSS